MNASEIDLLKWSRFAFVAINLLLATGCQIANGGLTRQGDTIIQNRLVAIPNLEPDSRIISGKEHRLKVSSINISAPRKRQKLAENRSTEGMSFANNFNRSRRFGVIYWLKNDAEGLIEDSLRHVFEIDPSSSMTVNVTSNLEFTNNYTHDSVCSYWDTTTKISLNVVLVTGGKITRQEKYHSEIKETYCAAMQAFFWLHEDFITTNMRDALHAVILEMVQDLKDRKLAGHDGRARNLS